MSKEKATEPTLDDMIDALTEEQAKFLIKALVASGNVSSSTALRVMSIKDVVRGLYGS